MMLVTSAIPAMRAARVDPVANRKDDVGRRQAVGQKA
jgi:hypothetical protein